MRDMLRSRSFFFRAARSLSPSPKSQRVARPHRSSSELVGPEGVPRGVVADIGDSGVEADALQFPSLPRANLFGERGSVVVGVRIPNASRAAWNRFWPSTKATARSMGGSALIDRSGQNNPARGLSACRAGSKYPERYYTVQGSRLPRSCRAGTLTRTSRPSRPARRSTNSCRSALRP